MTLTPPQGNPQDLLLPAQLTTELEAVNVLISSMGEAPVSTLSPSPSTDVDLALGALNETMRSVQSRGWRWNQEVALPLPLAQNTGYVPLPSGLLKLALAYFIPNQVTNVAQPVSAQGFGFSLDVVPRGNFLYDRIQHSYNFSVYGQPAVYIDCTLLLEWDFIPEAARRVITLEAVELFQSRDQMAAPTLQVNAKVLKSAWATLEQLQDDLAGPVNQIYGNIDSLGKIMGTGSMVRNRVNG